MSCTDTFIATPLGLDCSGNSGGLRALYFNDHGYVDPDTLVEAAGVITTIDVLPLTTSPLVLKKFQQIKFKAGEATWNTSGKMDRTNGTTYFEITVTLNLRKMTAAKREYLETLSIGQKDIDIIVYDNNLKYWLVGFKGFGAQVATEEGTSGTTRADRNGYVLTFVAEEPERAPEIATAEIAAIVTAATDV